MVPSPKRNFTAPNRERIDRMSRRLIPTAIRFTGFFLGGSSLVEIGDLLRLWRDRPFAEIVLEQASVADEDGAEG